MTFLLGRDNFCVWDYYSCIHHSCIHRLQAGTAPDELRTGETACQDFLLDKQDKKKKQETTSYPLSELENVSKLFINNRKNQRNASKKEIKQKQKQQNLIVTKNWSRSNQKNDNTTPSSTGYHEF